MKPKKTNLSRLRYLDAVTDLLQRIRLESPSAGMYEAADLQWWWREDDAAHSDRQTFWCDAKGTSLACLLRFDSGDEWNNEFFVLPFAESVARTEIWPEIVEELCRADKPSTIMVREDDLGFRDQFRKLEYRRIPSQT